MESAKGKVKHDCCETCSGWQRTDKYAGMCQNSMSLNIGQVTDSRYKCPAFDRVIDK